MTMTWDELRKLRKAELREVYSKTVVNHAINQKNAGVMEDADGFAEVTGPCGDTMNIWLKVKDNTIVEATFMTDGCVSSIASGSMVTEIATGKSVIQAMKVNQQDVLNALGGLPKESQHCALLAANTLKAAAKSYLEIKREPWRKMYRNY